MSRRVVVAAVLLAGAALIPVDAKVDTAVETAPLGGYTAAVSAAPVMVRIFEPVIPLPASPQAEVDLSYTQVTTSTGPTTRAVASTVWPGAGIGDGFGTITEALQLGRREYPFIASATYPGGQHAGSSSVGPAATMSAAASEKVSTASATFGQPSPASAVVSVAQASSTSTTTLTASRVEATSLAVANDIVLAGGLVRIAGVRAETTVASGATTATSGGESVVAGLTIAGVPFFVDERGVHAAGQTAPIPGLPREVADVLKGLGITVTGPTVLRTAQGGDASYASSALQISIDTGPLRTALSDRVPYRQLYNDVVAALPPEIRDIINNPSVPRVIDLGPRIVYDIGVVGAVTSGFPAFSFSPIPFSPLPDVGAAPPLALPPVTGPGAVPPTVTGPVTPPAAVPVGLRLPASYAGLPGWLLMLAVLLAGLGSFWFRWLSAVLLPVAADGCSLGADEGVPTLRED